MLEDQLQLTLGRRNGYLRYWKDSSVRLRIIEHFQKGYPKLAFYGAYWSYAENDSYIFFFPWEDVTSETQ